MLPNDEAKRFRVIKVSSQGFARKLAEPLSFAIARPAIGRRTKLIFVSIRRTLPPESLLAYLIITANEAASKLFFWEIT